MKQALPKKSFARGSLSRERSPRTVLLRMAADEARAIRLRELKADRPDLTWARIADAVGVTERSAHTWRKTGAIDYKHVAPLAQVFGVDPDWLWRGPKRPAPPIASANQVADVREHFQAEVDTIKAELAGLRQDLANQYRILSRILNSIGSTEGASEFLQGGLQIAALAEGEAEAPAGREAAPAERRRRRGAR